MRRRYLVLCLLILLVSTGCAQKVAFNPSPEAPAAQAEATITKDANGNTRIALQVVHLAPAKNLTPPKDAYVVWAETPDGRTINLGRLVVGKNRQGQFEGVTPLKEFRLLISAEDLVAANTPSKPILVTEVMRVK